MQKIGGTTTVGDEVHVVLEIIRGQITRTEEIRSYVANNIMVHFNGEPMSLREIIDYECDRIMSVSKRWQETKEE